MRGRHRSRSIESVEAEIRHLVAEGVKEINLISQDTTYYGMDLWNQKAGPRQPVDSARGPTLTRLLERIEGIPGDFWVRLLYTHPAHWSVELMEAIAASSKVVKYVDMPLQHIDEEMLLLMRRETVATAYRGPDSGAPGDHPGDQFADHIHRWISRRDREAF